MLQRTVRGPTSWLHANSNGATSLSEARDNNHGIATGATNQRTPSPNRSFYQYEDIAQDS
eukprot:2722340-Amphidinium_carterae.2